ncbi:MAG: hypothetical protein NUV74_04660 [Candidatus Brocadiaceae bacterium]|nr:hypothetical protein [Candidatus Brocadiaceae bacterium]
MIIQNGDKVWMKTYLLKKSRDEEELENFLKSQGKGIGDVTVNIFLLELRNVWPKARPKASTHVELAAQRLGFIKQGEECRGKKAK